jgi:hypothetical protein
MAKGLYWLHELEQAQEPRAPGVKVRLSPEVVALVAKQKKTGETLAAAVDRLLKKACDSTVR